MTGGGCTSVPFFPSRRPLVVVSSKHRLREAPNDSPARLEPLGDQQASDASQLTEYSRSRQPTAQESGLAPRQPNLCEADRNAAQSNKTPAALDRTGGGPVQHGRCQRTEAASHRREAVLLPRSHWATPSVPLPAVDAARIKFQAAVSPRPLRRRLQQATAAVSCRLPEARRPIPRCRWLSHGCAWLGKNLKLGDGGLRPDFVGAPTRSEPRAKVRTMDSREHRET